MKKEKTMNTISKIVKMVVDKNLRVSANSRCIMGFHQPEVPEEIKRFKKY